MGIRALGNSGGETFVGILMIIVGVGFGLSAMADFYMLVKVSFFFLINWIMTKVMPHLADFNNDKLPL